MRGGLPVELNGLHGFSPVWTYLAECWSRPAPCERPELSRTRAAVHRVNFVHPENVHLCTPRLDVRLGLRGLDNESWPISMFWKGCGAPNNAEHANLVVAVRGIPLERCQPQGAEPMAERPRDILEAAVRRQ